MDLQLERQRLVGLELRYALSLELLAAAGNLSMVKLVAALERDGFLVLGRSSKTVSDALRWEVRRGRVLRLGRGLYASGKVPSRDEEPHDPGQVAPASAMKLSLQRPINTSGRAVSP